MTPGLEQPIVLEIDAGQCVGCAICVDVCPDAALAMGPDDLRPVWRAEHCTPCDKCVHECPTAAISLKPGPPTSAR